VKTYPVKITSLYVEAVQGGFYVKGILSVPTRTQFDDVTTSLTGTHKTRSLFLALWRFRKDAKEHGRRLQSEPGNYSLTPTNFRKGLLFT
jgi:hypothetical protein